MKKFQIKHLPTLSAATFSRSGGMLPLISANLLIVSWMPMSWQDFSRSHAPA
jgi:hypothetical protein